MARYIRDEGFIRYHDQMDRSRCRTSFRLPDVRSAYDAGWDDCARSAATLEVDRSRVREVLRWLSAPVVGVFLGLLAAVLLGLYAPARGEAVALPKVGSCPSGYLDGGRYCEPTAGARHAVVKAGSCPSGYAQSGAYCLRIK